MHHEFDFHLFPVREKMAEIVSILILEVIHVIFLSVNCHHLSFFCRSFPPKKQKKRKNPLFVHLHVQHANEKVGN